MTVTNHVLAGALIGLVVKEPAFALVLAFCSHFVLDSLPHFGYKGNSGYTEALRHKITYIVGIFTLITTVFVIFILIINQLWLALAAGMVAALPDAIGLYNYLRYEKYSHKAKGLIKILHVQFHRKIQWCERPWGVYIEILTFIGLLTLLLTIVY